MSEESLHPNLARLAAAYDQVLEQLNAGLITSSQARAKIEALEARDDQGVRWSIDPNTGDFVRRTAFGELEFGTPPGFGVSTPDAFSVSDPDRDDNPNLRLSVSQVGTFDAPAGMAGATRSASPDLPAPAPGESSGFMAKLTTLPNWVKYAVIGVVFIAVAAGVWVVKSSASTPTPTPTPTPTISAPAPTPSPSPTETKKKKKKKDKKASASAKSQD